MFIVQILEQKVELNMHVIIIVNKMTSKLLYILTPHNTHNIQA
jgi:hypothetical protein